MGLTVVVEGFADGAPIPGEFAFCAGGGLGANRNPTVRWSGVPDGTQSFLLLCVDGDAPTVADDVNVEGRTVSADLPRADFSHWVLADVPADTSAIDAGTASEGVTPHGKGPADTPIGVAGRNDYTSWFAGDSEMEGVYHGYDGPCPPSNDELVHHYRFEVHALDVASLGLDPGHTEAEARAAADGHILDSASYTGTYTLNPALR